MKSVHVTRHVRRHLKHVPGRGKKSAAIKYQEAVSLEHFIQQIPGVVDAFIVGGVKYRGYSFHDLDIVVMTCDELDENDGPISDMLFRHGLEYIETGMTDNNEHLDVWAWRLYNRTIRVELFHRNVRGTAYESLCEPSRNSAVRPYRRRR